MPATSWKYAEVLRSWSAVWLSPQLLRRSPLQTCPPLKKLSPSGMTPGSPGAIPLKKVAPANVINIGVPPSAVPEIHKSGRRALQYVTYYQKVF